MASFLKRLLRAPSFSDRDLERRSRLLAPVLWAAMVVTAALTLLLLASGRTAATPVFWISLAGLLTAGGLLGLLRFGHVNLVSILYIAFTFLLTTLLIATTGGVRSSPMPVFFLVCILLAGLLLDSAGASATALLGMIATLGLYTAEARGLIEPQPWGSTPLAWIAFCLVFGLVALILHVSSQAFNEIFRRSLTQEKSLSENLREVQHVRTRLEQKNAEYKSMMRYRTALFQATSEVARQATATQDLEELLASSVGLIRGRLNLHLVGIFLLDARGVWASLKAASSDPGRGWLPEEVQVATTGASRLAEVVRTGEASLSLQPHQGEPEDARYVQADTRSQVLLPLKADQRVIGILDLQSRLETSFHREDLPLLQIMADQLTMAVENVRIQEAMQRTVRELEAAYERYTQEAWTAFDQEAPSHHGYRYHAAGLEILKPGEGEEAQSDLPESENGRQAAQAGELVWLPIRLRNQIIGRVGVRLETGASGSDVRSLVEEAADRLALALENARLLEETRRQAKQERLVGEMTSRMRETLDVETVLRTLALDMRRMFNLAEVEVHMGAVKPDGSEGIDGQ